MAADLPFPLHVLERRRRLLTVLDGTHRLLKADLLGYQAVNVKGLPDQLLDRIGR
jgi:hypothetical protein